MRKPLNANEVVDLVGYGRTKLFYLLKAGKFPEPIYRERNIFLWNPDDIEQYLINRGDDE